MKDYTESDLQEIAKTIESMPGICADGKKGVTALVEKLVGRELKPVNGIEKLTHGSIWKSGPFTLLISGPSTNSEDEGFRVLILSNRSGNCGTHTGDGDSWASERKALHEELMDEDYEYAGQYNFKAGLPL